MTGLREPTAQVLSAWMPMGPLRRPKATVEGTVVNPGAMIADGRMVFAGTLGKGLLVGDGTGTRWKTITAGLPSLNCDSSCD
jgi:hypothetical protein